MLSLIILMIFVSNTQCSIVSQSSISICEAGNDNEPKGADGDTCERRMIVSLALRSRQGGTESLYANIDQAYEEGETELSRLQQPFRIEIYKSGVVASYRVNYLGSANAKPNEVWFHRRQCRDDWFGPLHELACGKQFDTNGQPVWDSQGFCCRCNDYNLRYNYRGNHSCFGSLISGPFQWGSAHCMQFHDLWYNVFSIGPPFIQYNITVKVFQFNGVVQNSDTESLTANWTQISEFYLSPSRITGRSNDGRVTAEIQGNLIGAFGPVDLSYKYLLVPSVDLWPNSTFPEQYTNGPSDWLLVDRDRVDLSGLECSKIGINYSGFRRQRGRCDRRPQTCFENQPLDLWESDKNLQNNTNRTARYLLSSIGKVDESVVSNNNSFIVRLIYEDLYNTFVTLRIDASDLLFVYNVGSGRIVNTYATDFEALATNGMVVVEIENTGDISAEFSVSVLNCGVGVHAISARTLFLDPGQSVETTFIVQSFNSQGASYVCEATVDFRTNSTCFCFGSCGCTCDNANGTVECPQPPPVVIDRGSLALRIFFFILETIGLHGIVGFIGGILIILGFTKLAFGKILFCRRTKAQKFANELKKQGPVLVQCSCECRGAKAAKSRYERKLKRLKKRGKKTNKLDDWRNYSYSCTCNSELTDIKFMEIIKAVFFFYYCIILPCVWIGRKCVWSIIRDTAKQKAKAKQTVLKKAYKKGKISKYHFDAVEEQLAEIEKENIDNNEGEDKSEGEKWKTSVNSNKATREGNKCKETKHQARLAKMKKQEEKRHASAKLARELLEGGSSSYDSGKGKPAVRPTPSKPARITPDYHEDDYYENGEDNDHEDDDHENDYNEETDDDYDHKDDYDVVDYNVDDYHENYYHDDNYHDDNHHYYEDDHHDSRY